MSKKKFILKDYDKKPSKHEISSDLESFREDHPYAKYRQGKIFSHYKYAYGEIPKDSKSSDKKEKDEKSSEKKEKDEKSDDKKSKSKKSSKKGSVKRSKKSKKEDEK